MSGNAQLRASDAWYRIKCTEPKVWGLRLVIRLGLYRVRGAECKLVLWVENGWCWRFGISRFYIKGSGFLAAARNCTPNSVAEGSGYTVYRSISNACARCPNFKTLWPTVARGALRAHQVGRKFITRAGSRGDADVALFHKAEVGSNTTSENRHEEGPKSLGFSVVSTDFYGVTCMILVRRVAA